MRMNALTSQGLSMKKLEELGVGPILFREEAVFRREILFEDEIIIDVQVVKCREDFARWSLRHHFTKADGTLAAIINIDGAWIDLQRRKLAIPDPFIIEVFSKFPKADDFELLPK